MIYNNEINSEYLKLRKEIIKSHFARMNNMQFEAVMQATGPVLILAGAGSGKTTVLVNRIANLIEYGDTYNSEYIPQTITDEDINYMKKYLATNDDEQKKLKDIIGARKVSPWNILAITFTNKAARELRERLSDMLGEVALDINASTFHSTCVKILHYDGSVLGYNSNFTIYDSDDSARVIKEILKSLKLDDKTYPPKSVLGDMGRFKDKLLTPDEAIAQYSNASLSLDTNDFRLLNIAKIYKEYQKILKNANALDFDDIITQTVKLFMDHPEILEKYRNRYRYIMVDEYQDTNNAQYMLVSLLAGKHQNLCVVGDDDQSIYKFRGATIENIMSFEKQFPKAKVIKLEQNYRCTQSILDAANSVIENNTQRTGKKLWTDNGTGSLVKIYRARDEFEEARYISDIISENVKEGANFSDHAILYRMNAQSNAIEKVFIRCAIPYRIFGGLKFYERKEIKDVVAYLSVMNNTGDTLRLKRIINEPKRGIGNATLNVCNDIAENLGMSMFEVMLNADEYAPLSRKFKPLKEFATIIADLQEKADTMPLGDLLDELLNKTGYEEMLKEQGIDGMTRMENISELKSNMVNYEADNEEPTLSGFLEEISLYTDLDKYDEQDTVVMMTLHSAKGLEFPNVFIAGMEENVFPSAMAQYDPKEIEEERRLAYVGITRAKQQLYLTSSGQRLLFGKTNCNSPSRFSKEIPEDICESIDQTMRIVSEPPKTNKIYTTTSKTIGVGATMEEDKVKYVKGDKIHHKIFGDGYIISTKEMGNDHLLEIEFMGKGIKKIMANFAKLEKIQ